MLFFTGHQHTHIAGAGTSVISANPGRLMSVSINTPDNGATITIYDNTAASGAVIASITLPTDASAMAPTTLHFAVAYTKGLTIVTTGSGLDITAVWQ